MENRFAFARDLVYQAGAYLLDHQDHCFKVETKSGPTDLVTQLDQEVQDFLVERILARYPQDGILAEEKGLRHQIDQGPVWIIDPIDGTTNFVTQRRDYAIMLAYFEDGVGQFGIIYDVSRGEIYHGGGRFDVYCNEKKLPPFQNKPLSDFLLAANAGMLESNHWGVADLAKETLGVRVYGSAGISFSKVLSGQLLTYLSYIWPWDYAAAAVMGEKLGYCLLTFDGERPDFQTRQGVIMLPKEKISEFKNYIKKED
ncbi:inositol monophosphatase family protein [Streptococcus oricebi]|uniref:Inositol monophosphatase n=1 Tax=Streptococcus oricebi TaxID=1547447 RepID=A0ABS5B3K6_9STRE|nr:inositol monophosphatase family protein [Streptococcus oricebi]MBP2623096.1 inositol monophosphatase [Streptococcus oricebi]